MDVLTALIQGILTGGLYTATALGLTLIFGVLRIVNLAHGEFVIAGGFLSLAITNAVGLDPLLTLPVVMAAGAAVGWALHRGLLGPLTRKGPTQPLVATFGLALLIQAAVANAYGYNAQSLNAPYGDSGLDLLGVRVQTAYVIALGVAVVLTAITWYLVQRTRWGAAVRAAGRQPDVAALVGIDVRRLHATVFALACALAVAGGVLVGVSASFTPTSGAAYLVFGFTVVVLGGIGNVPGTLLAAMTLGVIQSLTSLWLGGEYRDLAVYALFLALLAVRPQGLFTKVSTA
ncbi:MAG: branched-chain amino acid ABC transporter permease [Nocardioides sp.]